MQLINMFIRNTYNAWQQVRAVRISNKERDAMVEDMQRAFEYQRDKQMIIR